MSLMRKRVAVFLVFALVLSSFAGFFGVGVASANEDQVQRIEGNNRYDTAAKIAEAKYPSGNGTVIVARGDVLADGLAASVLAGALDAPILLTKKESLPAETKAAIQKLGAKKVYILGSTEAIKAEVEAALKNLVGANNVERITGKDRYETAANIAQSAVKSAETAYIVNGGENGSVVDALTAGPAAFAKKIPVLPVKKDSVPAVIKDALKNLGVKRAVIVGSTDVVSNAVKSELEALGLQVNRVYGNNRIETSVAFAKSEFSRATAYAVVKGRHNGSDDGVDAIASVVLGNPILYTDPKVNNGQLVPGVVNLLNEALSANPATKLTVFGDKNAVSDEVANELIQIAAKYAKLKVVSVSAINLKQVKVQFNKEMDEETATDTAYYSVTANPVLTVTDASLSEDKKSVVLTFDNAFANQTGKVTVTIDGDIKDANGNKLGDDVTVKDITYTDLTLPTVSSVKAVGNKKLIVTFSEPIKTGANVPSNYLIDGQLFSATNISVDNEEATIELANALSAGTHTLKIVANKFEDYAGLKNAEETVNFTVDAVTTPPAATIVSATTTQVVFKFDREVKTSPVVVKFGNTQVNAQQDAVDKTKYTATFPAGTIPYAGGELVILKGIEDYYGNKTTEDIKLPFTPSFDTVKPSVLGVTSDKEGEIVVEFSEEIQNPATGTFTVKDKDGKVVSPITVGFAKTDTGKDIKTKALIKGSFTPTAAPYKVSISGVKDLAGNPMDAVTDLTVTVPDKTAPSVVSVTTNDAANKFAITFNEALDLTAATNVANYKYEESGVGIYAMPSGTTVDLSADGKTVTITVPSSWKQGTATKTIADIDKVYLSGIKDRSGNVMPDQSHTVPHTAETLATVDSVEAVAKDKLVITLSDTGSVPSTLYAGDFVVYKDDDGDGVKDSGETTTVVVKSATLSGREITLELAGNIGSDAKLNGNDVAVTMVSDPVGTATALGTDFSLAGTGNDATKLIASDEMAPTVDIENIEVADDGSLKVTLPLTENVQGAADDASAELEAALLVKVDGETLVNGTDFTADESTAGQLVVTFTNNFDLTQNIEISIPESAALQAITDAAGNKLGTMATQTVKFDFDNAVEGKVVPVASATAGTDYKVVDGVLYLKKTWVDANKATAPNGNDYVELEVQDAGGTKIDLSAAVAGTYSYASGDGNNWTTLENNTDTTLWTNAASTDLKYFVAYNDDDGKLYVVKYQIVENLPQ